MKVSYSWLQTYFKDKIPEPTKLSELFTFHSFEVEGEEKIGNDVVFDVKILPDRANYALSHRGVAREISYITGLPIDQNKIVVPDIKTTPSTILELDIQTDQCRRNSMMVIQNVVNGPSPAWLKEKLELLGQRSISFIVDVTNYVMLDMGQPLHAFDLDKLVKKDDKIKLVLKSASPGEKITILGGKEYILDQGVLIFADGNNNDMPLDIAGIKGGSVAEIDATTQNIVVLSANFEPSYIRKTSTKIGIRTDASKRSENGIPLELTLDGLLRVAAVITLLTPQARIEGIIDYYPKKLEATSINITTNYLYERLGIEVSDNELETIFEQLNFEFKKQGNEYSIVIPYYRLDLHIPEDIVEEVARIYGYDKIPAKFLPETSFKPQVIKSFYYENKIRDVLVNLGFREVYTYTFKSKGDIELEKSLASDKNFLRNNLSDGILQSLELNARNADLLGLDQIKIFEIGTVFTKAGQYTSLAMGVKNIKKLKKTEAETLQEAVRSFPSLFKEPWPQAEVFSAVFEVNLDEIISKLPEPTEELDYNVSTDVKKYQKFSLYPFSVRDIAIFTPEETEEKTVQDLIEKEAGELLVRNTLFDVFTKTFPDGTKKTSYAFRLVLQSKEKTLTEEEINSIMNRITIEMNLKDGWHVR